MTDRTTRWSTLRFHRSMCRQLSCVVHANTSANLVSVRIVRPLNVPNLVAVLPLRPRSSLDSLLPPFQITSHSAVCREMDMKGASFESNRQHCTVMRVSLRAPKQTSCFKSYGPPTRRENRTKCLAGSDGHHFVRGCQSCFTMYTVDGRCKRPQEKDP